METRNCQNCKKDFNIDQDDTDFYAKIKVPHPTWCPDCRMMRRMVFMNIFSLYKRACDKCKTMTVSMYPEDSPLIVYCSKCWWADDWDGTEYAMQYNPDQPFLAQLKELMDHTPHMALDTLYSSLSNASYTNYTSYLKNSYALFFADYCENSFYSEFLNGLTDSADCHRMRKSELCYGCVGMNESSRCIYSEECDNCVGVLFSKNCYGCTDCFGCMNLRGKSYYIFNVQHTKEEYFAFLAGINLTSYSTCQKYRTEAQKFWLTQPVRPFYGNSLNVNVSGDYIYESKNVHNAYLVSGAEDSRYVQMLSVAPTKDAYDYTCWGGNCMLTYETLIAGHGSSNIRFSVGSYPNAFNNEYSYYASGCKNILGCTHLKRKSYCILNKEYTKEEYEKLRTEIIENMQREPYTDSKGQSYAYGEFFPLEFSAFSYNETAANLYIPKTQVEVEAAGLKWAAREPNQYSATIQVADMPDTREELSDPTSQIIECACGRCYRIVSGELNVIIKLGIFLPHKCPECRRNERFVRVNPPKLYNRICQKCSKDIVTSYDPERPEIVYCESCYQQEII